MLLRVLLFVVLGAIIWKWLQGLGKPQALPKQRAKPDAFDPYVILGVKPGSAFEAIKAAYQDKVKQYHPDRVAEMGPELRDLAEQRTKDINRAYEALKRR